MLDDHDNLLELRRQLQVVRRRVDETTAALAESHERLTADGLEGVAAETWAQGRGDLFQLCVRLEVALAESRESLEKLTRRLAQLAEGNPQGWPWVAEAPGVHGQGREWQH